jgi:hypothetical protein
VWDSSNHKNLKAQIKKVNPLSFAVILNAQFGQDTDLGDESMGPRKFELYRPKYNPNGHTGNNHNGMRLLTKNPFPSN